MVPRPGMMMTILLILTLGRLGQTAVRTAKPDSPNSATRLATAEYVAELSHGPLARSAHARSDESFFAGHGLLAKSNTALRGREKESADERPRGTRSGPSHDSTACMWPAGDGGLCGRHHLRLGHQEARGELVYAGPASVAHHLSAAARDGTECRTRPGRVRGSLGQVRPGFGQVGNLDRFRQASSWDG